MIRRTFSVMLVAIALSVPHSVRADWSWTGGGSSFSTSHGELATWQFASVADEHGILTQTSDHPAYASQDREVGVPEPATMVLLVTGLLGIGYVAARHRENPIG